MEYTDSKRAKSVTDTLHWRVQATAFALALMVFTILGPFDTYTAPFLIRVSYWGLSLLIGWVCLVAVIAFMFHSPSFESWSALRRVAVSVLLASVPIWLLVSMLNWLFYARDLHLIDLIHVFFSCAVIAGMQYYFIAANSKKTKSKTHPFFKRIPVELGQDLISLSTQDHYVEVTTKAGSKLILLRFSDALQELSGFEGAQIHRSHWVALKAVRKMMRQNDKLVVELFDGRVLPVSRTFASKVRAALA